MIKQKQKNNHGMWLQSTVIQMHILIIRNILNALIFLQNIMAKYLRTVILTASATTFWSKWDASGQIPDRAVKEGIIGFYGAIDPFEGGITYRTNGNVQLTTSLNNGGVIKNQVYYSRSHFDLHTNFTFYLVDTVNGDEIQAKRRQRSCWVIMAAIVIPVFQVIQKLQQKPV